MPCAEAIVKMIVLLFVILDPLYSFRVTNNVNSARMSLQAGKRGKEMASVDRIHSKGEMFKNRWVENSFMSKQGSRRLNKTERRPKALYDEPHHPEIQRFVLYFSS